MLRILRPLRPYTSAFMHCTPANGSSKQPEVVLGHSGGCGEERACSQHPPGLGHLSIGLVFPDSSWGAAAGLCPCVCRKGRASAPVAWIQQCNRKGRERKTRLRQPKSWLETDFWLDMFCFSSLGMSQGSVESFLSKDCWMKLSFLILYELEGFIFQPKGPVSDFLVFFRDSWATRLDIFTGKHSEPLDRGSDASCPRETYGECTGLWPALLFNTPACTLSRELKAQLWKCQVMTFSFPFENYPTVKWILPFQKLFFFSSPLPPTPTVFMLQIEGMQNCMVCIWVQKPVSSHYWHQ